MSTEENVPAIDWVVSSSPHIRASETTGRIMWTVAATMLPAAAWSVYIFGLAALYVMIMCVLTCIAAECACNRLRQRRLTIADGSAVVTGLLLAFVLPSHSIIAEKVADSTVFRLGLLDWKVPVLGSIFAIAVVKHCFGGLGHNIWNPALAGRAFVQLSFGKWVTMPQWPWPPGEAYDAITQATSLSKTADGPIPIRDLFFGNCPGSLGEISAFLLLLGAGYLVIKKHVNWRLPLGYLVALALFATLFAWKTRLGAVPVWVNEFAGGFESFRAGKHSFGVFGKDWTFFVSRQVLSGGVMLGALFMATDMVTSPLTRRGQLYYGIGCGLLTTLIRSFSSMPEGVCYAILLMNTVRPHIERISRTRVLGRTKETS